MISLRPARSVADAWRLYRWRNEMSARYNSRNPSRIGWFDHWHWFRERRIDASRPLFIACTSAGVPVGMVGLEMTETRWQAEVSLSVDRAWRGYGIGTAMLILAEREARDRGVRRICASIRSHNTASIAAFNHAGYAQVFEAPTGWVRMDRICN